MTIKRWLLGATAAVGLAGSAAGQGKVSPWPENAAPPLDWFAKADAPAVAPTIKPAAASDVLMAPPGPAAPSAVPAGTVTSPWCGDGPAGCCGPVGGNGPLSYELYFRTGPSIVWGSELARTLNTGWQVGGGTRTLLFNQPRDAAWALIAGISYTYNRGQTNGFLDVGSPNLVNVLNANGQPIPIGTNQNGTQRFLQERGADVIRSRRVRGFHRTSVDFGFGRDWFMRTGSLPDASSCWRVGADIGGRWGTGHVDLVPRENPRDYERRGDVFHSLWSGVHLDWERNMGGWVLFVGGRIEYDITWANHVPPRSGDLQSLNVLMTLGVRF